MSDDVSPAEWIAPRLTGGFGAVTRTVPCGYPAYARICHPAGARDGGLATWSEVAQATGRQTHPVMQWHALVVSADHLNANGSVWPGHNPEQGNFECFYGGSGDPTNVDYQAGARVTQSQFVALQPRGVIHGDVSLVITTGPSAPAPSPQPKDRASGETSDTSRSPCRRQLGRVGTYWRCSLRPSVYLAGAPSTTPKKTHAPKITT